MYYLMLFIFSNSSLGSPVQIQRLKQSRQKELCMLVDVTEEKKVPTVNILESPESDRHYWNSNEELYQVWRVGISCFPFV